MRSKNDDTARLCFELFKRSGKIGYYRLYKQLADGSPEKIDIDH